MSIEKIDFQLKETRHLRPIIEESFNMNNFKDYDVIVGGLHCKIHYNPISDKITSSTEVTFTFTRDVSKKDYSGSMDVDMFVSDIFEIRGYNVLAVKNYPFHKVPSLENTYILNKRTENLYKIVGIEKFMIGDQCSYKHKSIGFLVNSNDFNVKDKIAIVTL